MTAVVLDGVATAAAIKAELGFTPQQFATLSRNSFEASFLPPQQKASFAAEVDAYLAAES